MLQCCIHSWLSSAQLSVYTSQAQKNAHVRNYPATVRSECISLDRIPVGTTGSEDGILTSLSLSHIQLFFSRLPTTLGQLDFTQKQHLFLSRFLSLSLSTPLCSKHGGKIATILCSVSVKVRCVKRDYVLINVGMMCFRTTQLKTGIPIWNNELA